MLQLQKIKTEVPLRPWHVRSVYFLKRTGAYHVIDIIGNQEKITSLLWMYRKQNWKRSFCSIELTAK